MAKTNNTKILMVYIEPTPYVLGLINEIKWHEQIDVLFLGKNKSQQWNIPLEERWFVLPPKRRDKISFIKHLVFKNKYDVLHVAGWSEPFCLLFIILAKLTRTPVVVESDTQFRNDNSYWKRIVKRLFYPWFFSLINFFLPGGKRQAKYIEHYFVNPNRIMIAQMTVDVASIRKYVQTLSEQDRKEIRRSYNIPEEDVVFVFVGRLVQLKGIMNLMSAFSLGKYSDATLVMVGDGSMRQQVEEQARLNKKICYVGRLSGNDLLKVYYAADVVVLPSCVESWGLVVNEAMAVGRPVIVSDRVGCVDDLVVHRKTGLIVKAECVEQLQHAIEYMMNASDERIAMMHKSIELIEGWTLENEAKNICKAWQKVILRNNVILS